MNLERTSTTASSVKSGLPNPSLAYYPSSPSSGLAAHGITAAPTVPRAAVSAPAAPASNLGWMQPSVAPVGPSTTAVKLDDVTPDFVTLDGVESVIGESLGVKQNSAASVAVKRDGTASDHDEPDGEHSDTAKPLYFQPPGTTLVVVDPPSAPPVTAASAGITLPVCWRN